MVTVWSRAITGGQLALFIPLWGRILLDAEFGATLGLLIRPVCRRQCPTRIPRERGDNGLRNASARAWPVKPSKFLQAGK